MGPWGIAALVAIAAFSTETGRTLLKKALRTGLRAGYQAKESAGDLAGKAKESAAGLADKAKDIKDDLVAEIHEDRDEQKHKVKKKPKPATAEN